MPKRRCIFTLWHSPYNRGCPATAVADRMRPYPPALARIHGKYRLELRRG
jgi:hypothetical protein